MNRESWVFCSIALVLSLALCAVGFTLSAMPRSAIEATHRPAPPESLPDIDLGAGFGKVAVVELMGYYIENPPTPAAAGGVPAVKRFGGC